MVKKACNCLMLALELVVCVTILGVLLFTFGWREDRRGIAVEQEW